MNKYINSALLAAFGSDYLPKKGRVIHPTRDDGPMLVTPVRRKADTHRGYEQIARMWERVGVAI